MPFFTANTTTSHENTPVPVNNFNHSISQAAYVSAMVNHSRPALSSQALTRSGYTGVGYAERRGSNFAAAYNFPNSIPQAQGVVYTPAIGDSPLSAPAASRATNLAHTSGAFMPSDYLQLLAENFSDRFAPHTSETASSTLATCSNTNISLQSRVSSLINLLQAQQTYRAYSRIATQTYGAYNQIASQLTSGASYQMSAQKASGANNFVPLQLPRATWGGDIIPVRQASWALVSSDRSQAANAERVGQTNPAMSYNFSSSFAVQSSDMVSSTFASISIASWVDLVTVPSSPTAPSSGALVSGPTNNIDSLVCLLANPLPSDIFPVHGHSGPGKNSGSNKRVYRCPECPARFSKPQAFGGHKSSHSKEKKKQDQLAEMLHDPRELNLMPRTSGALVKDEGGFGARVKDEGGLGACVKDEGGLGSSEEKGGCTKKNKKCGSLDRSTPTDVDNAIESKETPVKQDDTIERQD